MKQKYQVLQHLEKFFSCSPEDHLLTKTKNIGSKRFVYSPGDQINHLYIVLAGEVNLSFQDKQIAIPPNNIVGDFEISKQLSRRTSALKAKVRAKILIVPKEFYLKIKQEVQLNDRFLFKCIQTENQKLLYFITKCFVYKIVMKGEWAYDSEQSKSVIIIKSGIFSLKKNIGVGIIRKHKIQIQKQFSLLSIGEREIVNQNIYCDSPKGEIFICKKQQAENLHQHFPEFKELLINCSQKKQSLLQRQKSIKKLCIPNGQLYESVLPSVFHSERKKSKQKMEKGESSKLHLKTQPSQRLQYTQFQKNHYSIKREKNNNIFSEQTNSNLSLVPLIKIRKPSVPETVRIPRSKVIERFFKNRTEKVESQRIQNSEMRTTNQLQIPEVFCKKFQKKMFIKPSNPFHHHKGKSLSLEENNNNDKGTIQGLRSSEDISKMSDRKQYKLKKSFLLVSGSLIQ